MQTLNQAGLLVNRGVGISGTDMTLTFEDDVI
jgi:adhesin HecA-like repeat protein